MVEHMKWWGWGDEDISFDHTDKPDLAPFVATVLDIDLNSAPTSLISFDTLTISDPQLDPILKNALEKAVGENNVVTLPMDRVVHAYGKGLRDLVRIRKSDLGRLPDVVVYPQTEDQISEIMRLALGANAVIIPFGGGTNIAGCLEAPKNETRTVISVDLGNLNKVLDIDSHSQLARIQAGALGPDLEAQLNEKGWTLGHFPDSFNHSTLGGWIATRSSGMQSDKYGDIADITKGIRMVTPNGTLVLHPLPASSNGPSVKEMVLGSEGRLGIISEATVQIHRIPEVRKILGYFFPTWESALGAMESIAASDAAQSVTRVADENETKFSLSTRKAGSSAISRLMSNAMKTYMKKKKHFDLEKMCLSFIGYEGTEAHVKRQRKLVGKIVSKHGGICVGPGPGALYDQKKFDTPYIRDFLLDRGALADVSDTATPWSGLGDLYKNVIGAVNKAFDEIGVRGFIMCHLAHSYHSGACLYFTFAFQPADGKDPLDQYDVVKVAIQQTFIDSGGTLSHHHGVGVEHASWLEGDISTAGVSMVEALFNGVDPARNLNPGKILADKD